MRLLHLYSGNLYGGIERVLITLAQAGVGIRSLSQSFALFYDGRLARDLRRANADVAMLGNARLSRPWRVHRARRTFSRCIAERAPDVVLAHSPWAFAVGAPVARRAGVRVALWLHGPVDPHSLVDRLALGTRPDVVVANSELTAARSRAQLQIAACVLPPVAAPAAIAPQVRTDLRTALGASPNEVVILHASRFEPPKGLSVLVDALAELRDEPRWKLWIAGAAQRRGEQSYFDALMRRAVTGGIRDRIALAGHRDDMPALMMAADIYCQPNTKPEPFGLATFEAAAAGLPVVITEGSAAAILLGRSSGRIVAPGDRAALAVALRSLIRGPALGRELGRNAASVAAEYCKPERQLMKLVDAIAGVAAFTPTYGS